MASERFVVIPAIMVLLFIEGFFTSGGAVEVVPRSIQSLTEAAEMIFVGKVALLRSEWNNKKSVILTRIEVEVEEPYQLI